MKLADADIQEIIPTADGGAYIWAVDGQLWYVRQGVAVRVREAEGVKISATLIPNAGNGLFALWIRERQKLKKLREELEEEKDLLEYEVDELKDKLNELETEEGGDEGDPDN